MKLIHRLQLELVSKKDSEGSQLIVTASFYRPFLDGSYKNMISQMIDSGCFDDFIASLLEHVIHSGETGVAIHG